MDQISFDPGPRQSRHELEPFSILFGRLTQRRGTLTALANMEADRFESDGEERDIASIRSRYTSYRKGTQRPSATSAFTIGESAWALGDPHGTAWSSGLLSAYAACYFEEAVLMIGALTTIPDLFSPGRLQLALHALDTIIFPWNKIDPRLLGLIRTDKVPAVDDINKFTRFRSVVPREKVLSLRQRFRDDSAARAALTFEPAIHDYLERAFNYHERKCHAGEVLWCQPLILALQASGVDSNLPIPHKKIHLAKHFDDLILEMYARRGETAPTQQHKSTSYFGAIREIQRASIGGEYSGSLRAEDHLIQCEICRDSGNEVLSKHREMDELIAGALGLVDSGH